MPKATIIVPTFNTQRKLLFQCIDSIKNQTFEDFECLVIDDGSTDHTVDFLKRITENDSRFKIIEISHSGLSIARNEGIKLATSNIIFHVDSDDEIKLELLQHVISFMEENDLEMVLFDAEVVPFGRNPHRFLAEAKYFERKHDYGINDGQSMYYDLCRNKSMIYSSFLYAIKKNCIKSSFYPRMRAQDELNTTLNMLQLDRVGHLNEKLYIKKSHSDSVSYQKRTALYYWSIITAALEICKFINNNQLEDDVKALLEIALKKKYLLIANLRRNGIYFSKSWLSELTREEQELMLLAFRKGKYKERPFYNDIQTLYQEYTQIM